MNDPASNPIGVALSDEGSVRGGSALSGMERIFAHQFVANGGKGTEAALAAGYSPTNASVAASRCLTRKRVADEIGRLCRTFIHSALPIAIQALLEIASDKNAKASDRIKAANSLLERGGLATEKGGVHVNVGMQVNGGQVQTLISSIWDARDQRLSGIPPAMSDSIEALSSEVERIEHQPLDPAPADTGGGIRIAGPVAESCPIAGYSSAKPLKADEFRRAFDDGGDDG